MANLWESGAGSSCGDDDALADFIRSNVAELSASMVEAYDRDYPHAPRSLPSAFWQEWAAGELLFLADQLGASAIDRNHYLQFQEGNMVIQSDRQLKPYMLALEDLFFCGKVLMGEIVRRLISCPQERRALCTSLERLIQAIARAYSEAFLESACTPGALLSAWAYQGTEPRASAHAATQDPPAASGEGSLDVLLARLTNKERAIADLVVKGLSNSEIAARLGVSQGTVKNHISHIFDKLEVTSRTELAVRMLQG